MKCGVNPIIINEVKDSLRDNEWIITNGLGGFASSTICGINTRRYHGYLVASLNPPGDRTLCVAKVEDTVIVDDETINLSTNEYVDEVHPKGFENIKSVSIAPDSITWDYGIVKKNLQMVYGENKTIITYKCTSIEPIFLELTPLINARDFHSETVAGSIDFTTKFYEESNVVSITAENINQEIHISANRGRFIAAEYWYYNFLCCKEVDRGLNPIDNHYAPVILTANLNNGEELILIFSTNLGNSFLSEEKFYPDEQILAEEENEDIKRLLIRADDFIVSRGQNGNKTIIAGYHWFGDWGRDTSISLPGLLFPLKRFDVARNIILTYTKHIKNGLVPNLFNDDGDGGAYNSVDASLLYCNVVREYIKASGDKKILDEIGTYLIEIVSNYMHGTKFTISMDSDDGLITTHAADWQLTWMDVKVNDIVVTPRMGKAIEVNALWYNALMMFSDYHISNDFVELARQVKKSFNDKFWYDEGNYLYDCIGDNCSSKLRPNQLFALSLHHGLIDDSKRAKSILNSVTDKLLTPYGLRSLSPADSEYRPYYIGDQWSRDTAYHQGTVWTWLIGPYIDAYLNVYGNNSNVKKHCRELLFPILTHSREQAAVGTISEIFDATIPFEPRGTISQAWSVGEVLRVWYKLKD